MALALRRRSAQFSALALASVRRASGGLSPLDKAKRYVETKDDPERELDEDRANMSFYPVGSGLGIAAEARIQAAIAGGALEGLKGTGKPLTQEDPTAQFARVDPLVAAVTRTMGTQNIRPESLELREELQRELGHFRTRLRVELQGALQQQGAVPVPAAVTSGGGGSWLRRWLGGAASSSSSSSSAGGASEGHFSVEAIQRGEHEGLQHDFQALEHQRSAYNSAVLSDKESLGAHWPLNQQPRLDFQAEVRRVLQELRGAG